MSRQTTPQPDAPPLHKRYMNQTEVLKLVRVSSGTIRRLEREGKFPARRQLSPRSVRWWMPDVLAWLENPEGWGAGQGIAPE